MELNNFGPFQADVWGTFSDWVMVVVTAFTAKYLYQTLQSQLAVQNLQQQVTSIESTRHRLEVLPLFTLSSTETHSESDDPFENVAVFIRFELKLSKNTCTDFKLELYTSPSGFHVINQLPIQQSFVNANTDLGFFGKFTSHTFQDANYEWSCNIYFNLEFKDILNNKYVQTIAYTLKNASCEIDNQEPILSV